MIDKRQATLAIAVSLTAFIISAVIAPLIEFIGLRSEWLGIAVKVVSAPVFFMLFTKLIVAVISRWTWLFKLIMGKYYLRGTWAGVITTASGKKLIFVEHYDQTTIGLTIRGRSYLTNTTGYDAQWSTLCAAINENHHYYYLYQTHVVSGSGSNDVRYGIGRFSITSRSENDDSPLRLDGFATDEYHNSSLTYVTVERIGDKLLDFDVARDIAFERFGSLISQDQAPS